MDSLRDLERRFWLAAGDGDFYRRHVVEDGLMVFPAPFGVMSKELVVAAVEESPRWIKLEMTDVQTLRLADSAAAIVYRADAIDATGSAYSAFISSVYTRGADDAWTLALHQQTPINATEDQEERGSP
jgi:hypothetical protein